MCPARSSAFSLSSCASLRRTAFDKPPVLSCLSLAPPGRAASRYSVVSLASTSAGSGASCNNVHVCHTRRSLRARTCGGACGASSARTALTDATPLDGTSTTTRSRRPSSMTTVSGHPRAVIGPAPGQTACRALRVPAGVATVPHWGGRPLMVRAGGAGTISFCKGNNAARCRRSQTASPVLGGAAGAISREQNASAGADDVGRRGSHSARPRAPSSSAIVGATPRAMNVVLKGAAGAGSWTTCGCC